MNHIKLLYQKSGCKTIQEFAEMVDIPKRTIEDNLYEKSKLKFENFIKICKVLNIDFETWFMEQIK